MTYPNCRSYDLHHYRASIVRSPATFRKTSILDTGANVFRSRSRWAILMCIYSRSPTVCLKVLC
ncbi:hypothetical protein [Chamaesiphon minutus]|uniref:hypothetical protein n=1 Tax=Chamaesiphon minutus TaxID=1173032 RepID=UPI0002FEE76E|nr:hypothetical protein [Chamaesiphon minutus]